MTDAPAWTRPGAPAPPDPPRPEGWPEGPWRQAMAFRRAGLGMISHVDPWTVYLWSLVLPNLGSLQRRHDLLELGVLHGGTAALSAPHARARERQHLVDAEQSPLLIPALDAVDARAARRVIIHVGRTDSPDLAHLARARYRWIHIDAGHSLEEVEHDLHRFAPALADDGMLVLDDFFQPVWPDVTQAAWDFLAANREFRPVCVAFNKLYVARGEHYAAYSALFRDASSELAKLGQVSVAEPPMMGKPVLAMTGAMHPRFRPW
jgi:hypothetical protein